MKVAHWSRGRWWAIVGASILLLIGLDYATGPYVLFPITFIVPVAIAGWKLGLWPALGCALVLTVSRYSFLLVWDSPELHGTLGLANALIRFIVLAGIGTLVDLASRQHRQLAQRVEKLEGLLPICSFCKKIRRQDGGWESVESYVTARSDARFSHGFCDLCAREHYPELFGDPLSAPKSPTIGS